MFAQNWSQTLDDKNVKNASQDADSFGTKYVCYNSLNSLNPRHPLIPPH